jgi:hypothetical protein
MEECAARRCQAWNSGERIADVVHPSHHWQMDAIFSPVAASAHAIIVQTMNRSLLPLVSPIVSLRVLMDRAVFLEEKSKE